MVIDEHIAKYEYDTPDDDEIVVHLRLSDKEAVKSNRYKIARRLRSHIIESKCKKVTLMTGLHYPTAFTTNNILDDIETLTMLSDYIMTSLGIDVEVRSSTNVDADFCYAVKAKHVALSVGSFTHIIGAVCDGTVYKLLPNRTRMDVLRKYDGLPVDFDLNESLGNHKLANLIFAEN